MKLASVQPSSPDRELVLSSYGHAAGWPLRCFLCAYVTRFSWCFYVRVLLSSWWVGESFSFLKFCRRRCWRLSWLRRRRSRLWPNKTSFNFLMPPLSSSFLFCFGHFNCGRLCVCVFFVHLARGVVTHHTQRSTSTPLLSLSLSLSRFFLFASSIALFCPFPSDRKSVV